MGRIPFTLSRFIYLLDSLKHHEFLLIREHLEQFFTRVLSVALGAEASADHDLAEVPVADLFPAEVDSVLVVAGEVDLEFAAVELELVQVAQG